MTIYYVDSSAWAKLIIEEPESPAVSAWLEDRLSAGDLIASSHLLVTELHRLAERLELSHEAVTASVSVIHLALPSALTYRTAGLLPGQVRSLDALHVASALDLGCDVFVSYDERQLHAATASGIAGFSPA